MIAKKKTVHNCTWSNIQDHSCRIFIVHGSCTGMTNTLLNLVIEENYIYVFFFSVEDLHKAKYKYLTNRFGNVGQKFWQNSNAFMDYAKNTIDAYKHNGDYVAKKDKAISKLSMIKFSKLVKSHIFIYLQRKPV